jgi:hypothetical protein
MQPITSAAMNGIGETPLGPVCGTHVIGFFRDSTNAQEPVIIGTIGGIPEEAPNTALGFYDPNGDYPLPDYLNEPDTNRLARNEKIAETIVAEKRKTRDKNIPQALGGKWEQPDTTYNAQYPYNHVKESESGHIEEVDDTPEAERTHRYNRSGSFEEIDKEGNRVLRIVKDRYSVILADDYIHVKGDKTETIDGTADLYIKGNFNIQIDGNVNMLVKGDVTQEVEGSLNISADEIELTASGDIALDASNIWLNSGKASKRSASKE